MNGTSPEFPSLGEAAGTAVVLADASLNPIWSSPAAAALLGPFQGKARWPGARVREEDSVRLREAAQRVALDGVPRRLTHDVGVGERALAVETEVQRVERGGARELLILARPSTEGLPGEGLELVAHAAPLPVLALAIDGTVRLWNAEAERVFGYSAREVLGRPNPIVPEEARAQYEELRRRALAGETVIGLEAMRCHKDGRRIEVSVSAGPLYDRQGRLDGSLAVVADLSARAQARQERRRAEEQYRTLLNSIDGIVWEADAGLRMTFVSAQAERILGYPAQRWLDDPGFWRDHLHPEDRDRAVRFCTDQTAKRLAHEFEYRMVHADGRVVWVHDIVSIVDEDGELKLRGVMIDVSARKAAEEERARLLVLEQRARAAAEEGERRMAFLARSSQLLAGSLDYAATLAQVARLALPECADWCIVDLLEGEDCRRVAVEHANPEKAPLARALREHFPLDLRWPEGISRVLREGRSAIYDEISASLLARIGRSRDHLRLLEGLGCRSAIACPLAVGGRILGIITFIYGDSGRRYRRADLALVEDLAGRAALAVENARLYRDARDAIELRDEFLAIASHELRTPCTALHLGVQQMARLLNQGPAVATPPTLSGLTETLGRQTRRLSQLIGRLLDVSKLSAGPAALKLEEVDAAAIAREVVAGFGEESSISHSAIEVDAPLPVVGRWDRLLLAQMVSNLLSNALKYGAGRPIAVRVAQGRGGLELRVHDRGIGIAAGEQAHIFERYGRAVSSRHYGGLGLGLYIARQSASALGGAIAVESAPGEGATFTVTLPLAGPPSTAAEGAAPASPG